MKTEREIELEKQVATLRAALQGFIDAVEVGRGPWAVREARAAIADTNLGADWVPRAELEAVKQKLHDLQDASAELSYAVVIEKERHQAELRRVAEAVRDVCTNCIVKDGNPMFALERIQAVDLDAIVRGGK